MNPVSNPFAPGAGTRPPSLAGRADLVRRAEIALKRTKAGRAAKGMIMLGLRGVGKTVLLVRISDTADDEGFATVLIEAPEDRSLAALIVPHLKTVLYKLSRLEKARVLANRALGFLRSFASAFRVSYEGIEVGIDPDAGLPASGDLETDLTQLFLAVGEAAAAADIPVVLLIDEVQYLDEEDLGALIVAMHRIGQKGYPMILFGAGLPQLAALSGEAKSYAERLFDFSDVGPLNEDASMSAIRDPIQSAGAEIEDDALTMIVARTEGYPYFLQEWGSHAWNAAPRSPISSNDVRRAGDEAIAALDQSFFRVRFDRLTPREQEYLRAMAELGPGPHRSGEIAEKLGISVTSAGPIRTGLIRKGMIWSPAHGETAFTVPMFDEYMVRVMPTFSSSTQRPLTSANSRERPGQSPT